MSIMKSRARDAYRDYTKPWERDKDEEQAQEAKQNFNMIENPAAKAAEEDEKEEPVVAKKEEEKEDDKSKKGSNWAGKVIAAIAGIRGAVAGANLQHKQNQRREKLYQAKRKTGNYL